MASPSHHVRGEGQMLEVPLYFLMPDTVVSDRSKSAIDVPPVTVVAQDSTPGYSMVKLGGHLNNPGIANPENVNQNQFKIDESYNLISPTGDGTVPSESMYNSDMVVSQRKHARIAPYHLVANGQNGVFNTYGHNPSITHSAGVPQNQHYSQRYISLPSYQSKPDSIQIYPVSSAGIGGGGNGQSSNVYQSHQSSLYGPQISKEQQGSNPYLSLQPQQHQQPSIAYDLIPSHYNSHTYKFPSSSSSTVNRIHHLKHPVEPQTTNQMGYQHNSNNNNHNFYQPNQNTYGASPFSTVPSSSAASSAKMQHLLGTLINILKHQSPATPKQVVHHVPVPVPIIPPPSLSLSRSSRRRRRHHRPVLSNFYGKILGRKGGSRGSRRYNRRRGRTPMYKRILRAYKKSQGDEGGGGDDVDDDGEDLDEEGGGDSSFVSVLGEDVSDSDVFDIEISEDGESEFALETSDNNYADYDEEY